MPLEANISIELGDKVTLVGFGLNATLSGQLAVRESPGDPTLGSGQIQVAGIYKAYGQDLKIETGRLLFASTPLANPQLNIIAVRDLAEVDARLQVTGTAERPILTVSSDPPLPQTQALSYLITGKPLSEVGQGEGDLVTSAARSLGGAAGNLLAKNIGKRLGIDEIGIEDSQEIGGSAFTVGQYLSPRLYLSYGVGLFEPGQVVTLRYRISDKWSLEGSQGPLNQRVGHRLPHREVTGRERLTCPEVRASCAVRQPGNRVHSADSRLGGRHERDGSSAEAARLVLDAWQFRHTLCWRSLQRFYLAAVAAAAVVPFILTCDQRADLQQVLWLFPVLGGLLAFAAVWHYGAEYIRLIPLNQAVTGLLASTRMVVPLRLKDLPLRKKISWRRISDG